MNGRSAFAGFTLIELLVVMVLLGLVAGVALTTVGSGNQSREMLNEANRLHAVLVMASEEAVFSNTEIGAQIANDGYEFLIYDEEKGRWDAADQSFLKTYTIPEWMSLDVQREGDEKVLARRKTAIEEEGDQPDEQNSKKPNLMLLSSGEVTPFVIGFEISGDSDSRLEIFTNEQDEIVFLRPGEEQE